jgi:hypothetical protein
MHMARGNTKMSSRKETKMLFEGWRSFLSESDVGEPSHEVSDAGSKKTHLAVFDWDGTIFNPVESPNKSMQYYWNNTLASTAGQPISAGVQLAKSLHMDHTICILTSRTIVDKKAVEKKTGKTYAEVFAQFMSDQNTSELTEEMFAKHVQSVLGFMPESIIRTNNSFNQAMYKKDEFPVVVRNFVKNKVKRHVVKYYDDDKKALEAVAGTMPQVSSNIHYQLYLAPDYTTAVHDYTSIEKRHGDTSPELPPEE